MILPQESAPSGKPDLSQIQAIVLRLEDFLATTVEEGQRLGLTLSAPQILSVIDTALGRLQGNDSPKPVEETVEGYFLDGFTEALLQEHLGIYEKVKDPDGQEVYVPISDALWIECLRALHESVAKIAS
ncbi:MAG: hypothetical protein PHD76_08195 [Methylacidiphilales bacterium]|nr:hypothetical protein [Candidatus Methylacidiphilales bacterium]